MKTIWRVLRGGSWINSNATNFRCADRDRYRPDNRIANLGFRCVLPEEEEGAAMSTNYHLLTPLLCPTYARVRMHVSAADSEKVTVGSGIKGVIEDVPSERRYLIVGAPCSWTNPDGTGCFCDAVAIPESEIIQRYVDALLLCRQNTEEER